MTLIAAEAEAHHTLPKQKLLKISSFRITTPPNVETKKSVLSRPPHPPKH